MALLHFRVALLQNSSVEQLYFRVLVVFNKINVYNSKKCILRVEKHYYPFFDQLYIIEDNETYIIIFSPIFANTGRTTDHLY
jgi:hypothetical protein